MPGGLTNTDFLPPLEAVSRYVDGMPDHAQVAVALSGGGDSLGLLVALHETLKQRSDGMGIRAITIDHGLRPEAATEAASMGDICRSRGIAHLTLRWDGPKPATGLADAARQARYMLLAEGVRRLGATCLVTAHTLDDQLETVEMRRRRSESSVRGLAGIAPAALFFGWLPVQRPFLGVRRADIRRFLEDRRVRWIDDPSNENRAAERVRIRQDGQFAMTAADIAAAGARRQETAEAAARLVRARVRMPMPMLFALDAPDLAEGEPFRLVLATLVAVAGGMTHLPGNQQLDHLLAALRSGGHGTSASLGRTVVEWRRGCLFIGRDRRNLPRLELSPGEDVIWDGRFRILNSAASGVTIVPGPLTASTIGGLPPRIARRAQAVMPDARERSGAVAKIDMHPYLAPFETVHSGFDVALSGALCAMTGRQALPYFLASEAKRSDNASELNPMHGVEWDHAD
jgi:tRNA(Ile)-lysidine synthase